MTPKLSSIYLDGGYSIDFSPEIFEYEVLLPFGHPRIPRICAKAEGAEVKITRAVIPDGALSGKAYIDLEADGEKSVYIINFVKDMALGFRLQYADRYKFVPKLGSENIIFESEAPEILSVDEKGVITAFKTSDTPIKIFARTESGELDFLTVDKTEKAPVNIFLITGQSNAAGTYDIPEGVNEGEFRNKQLSETLRPKAGTSFCLDIDHLGSICGGGLYDLSCGRAGFSPALGKRWYELTGEKTVMLQTAVGGAPIEAWMKPDKDNRYTYGNIKSNFYDTTLYGYNHILKGINAEGAGFELNKVYAFWLQGETGMASTYYPDKDGEGIGNWAFGDLSNIHSSKEYYDMFMKNAEYFKEDFGCAFIGILLVRAVSEAASEESREMQLLTELVPPRAAQYALNGNENSEIAIVSRVCDIARMESYQDKSDIGYGLMGCQNLHYNQSGHNKNGLEAAENTFKKLFGREENTAFDIEIIDSNGRKRFSEGEKLGLSAGEAHQISAMVLPIYTDTSRLIYKADDENVCTVDSFGMITASESGKGKETVLTVSAADAEIQRHIIVSVE